MRPAQVRAEFPRECRQVHVVAGGTPKNLGIRTPAQAFVALWTVRGNPDKIRTLPPQNVAPKLIQHGAAGFQRGGEWRIGVEYHGLNVLGPWLCRNARNLHVAESVEGERRLVLLDALAREDEMVGSLRRAQILGVQSAVWIQNFSKS